MCGFYGHGFWWGNNVVMDFEINSHSRQREIHTEIPAYAKRCGFDPINGMPVSNDDELPEEIKEKIHFLMESYFPDCSSIIRWMKTNYGKNDDKTEWNIRMTDMLDPTSHHLLFSTRHWQDVAKRWQDKAKRYQDVAKISTGTMNTMDIDQFCEFFRSHPNSYWAKKQKNITAEYHSFVRV